MKFLKALTGSAILAGLLLSAGGCELIVAPDRTKIGEGGGGQGGGGQGGGGQGGTGGTTTSTTEECTPVDDNKECTDDVCENGQPVSNPKELGTACTEGGGAVCDADGNCVQCNADADCDTNTERCDNEVCVPITCMDGIQNGTETDEDCGGSCPKCADDQACAVADDCLSGVCTGMVCQAKTCTDGVQNGDETGEDCGGSCVASDGLTCADGLGCMVGADCTSGVCGATDTCSAPVCGDGVENQLTESCDDGNMTNGDGCDNDCSISGCGNGQLGPSEVCDDGNMTNGDGCDDAPGGNCTPTACGNGVVTAGEDCDDMAAANGDGCDNGPGGNCTASACGNGVVAGTEGCDDGNSTNGDGCDDGMDGNCTATACGNGVLTGTEVCDDGNQTNGDGCDDGMGGNCTTSECGNGVVAGTEVCDDGNGTNGDGCDDGPGGNCTASACGNGVVTGTEACDDGNMTDGDGCNNDCTITGCGDGIVTGNEECDDENSVNGDGCDNNCTNSACGNGIQAGTEACDDGNTTNGDTCDNNCTVPVCGNGEVGGTEACDDGNNTNGDGCDNNCTATACGNGILTGTEACDDGNTANGDCCSSTCTVEPGCETEPNNTCGADVDALPAFAGTPPTTTAKGSINPGATDIDIFSFTIPGTGAATIKIDTFFGTPGTCASTSANDLFVELRPTNCTGTALASDDDDGPGFCPLLDAANDAGVRNLTPGTYFARVEHSTGSANANNYTMVVTIVAQCGNGTVESGENCDDGNNTNGDGCTSACQRESGFTCQGTTPTVCAAAETNCSDGIDNNGQFGADAMDPNCQLPAYYPACGMGQTLRVFAGGGGVIPDNNATGITSNVTVTGAGTIVRLSTLLNISHTFVGDVDMFLVTPTPTNIDICSDNGSGGDNFVNTVLDTTCSTNITAGTAPYTGCFIPENAATVTALAGTSANGTWGLRVADDATGDVGTLNNWRLVMCTTTCGDGIKAGAEACDDANTAAGDGCSATCTVESGYTCTGQGAGSCTDNNECMLNTDNCDANATCTNTPGSFTCACNTGYTGNGVTCAVECGDGIIIAPETCDDDNTTAGDGCSATCATETGYTCTGMPSVCTDNNECMLNTDNCDTNATCTNTPGSFTCACNTGYTGNGVTCAVECGDGIIIAPETCDDDNTTAGDGCSATCTEEAGFDCTGAPSVCTTTCGDGIQAGAEGCDDDDTDAGDGCSATCTVESGYTCTGTAPSVCADIDECMAGTDNCDANATCANTPGSFTCTCNGEYVGSGTTCSLTESCDELHTAKPALPSGDYMIDPDSSGPIAAFTVRCDMTTDGGGWTLAFNDGTGFDETLNGAGTSTGYTSNFINTAYSTVAIVGDVMIDASDAAIVGENQEHRSIITGVHTSSAGKTLREIFTGADDAYFEAEDNSNVANTGLTCGSFGKWADYESIVCNTAVLVGNDQTGASNFSFGIDASYSSTTNNAAGWPQDPNFSGTNFFPDNFRVWVR